MDNNLNSEKNMSQNENRVIFYDTKKFNIPLYISMNDEEEEIRHLKFRRVLSAKQLK